MDKSQDLVTIQENFPISPDGVSFPKILGNFPSIGSPGCSDAQLRCLCVDALLNCFTKGASTRSYTRLFYLVLLYVYDLLSLVHVQKYVCVYEYDVLQPCWIFVRRTRVRRTNVRASFL